MVHCVAQFTALCDQSNFGLHDHRTTNTTASLPVKSDFDEWDKPTVPQSVPKDSHISRTKLQRQTKPLTILSA